MNTQTNMSIVSIIINMEIKNSKVGVCNSYSNQIAKRFTAMHAIVEWISIKIGPDFTHALFDFIHWHVCIDT